MKSFIMPKLLDRVHYMNDYGMPCVKSAVGKPPHGCGIGNTKERKFS